MSDPLDPSGDHCALGGDEVGGDADHIKIVLLGSSGSGKTALWNALEDLPFEPLLQPSSSASFTLRNVDLDGSFMTVSLWDTAGANPFKCLAPMYYCDADAIMVCYWVLSADSFNDALEWLEELREFGPRGAVLALAGTHADAESDRQVPSQVPSSLSKQKGFVFKETSALQNRNVHALINEIITLVIDLRYPTIPIL